MNPGTESTSHYQVQYNYIKLLRTTCTQSFCLNCLINIGKEEDDQVTLDHN